MSKKKIQCIALATALGWIAKENLDSNRSITDTPFFSQTITKLLKLWSKSKWHDCPLWHTTFYMSYFTHSPESITTKTNDFLNQLKILLLLDLKQWFLGSDTFTSSVVHSDLISINYVLWNIVPQTFILSWGILISCESKFLSLIFIIQRNLAVVCVEGERF